VKENRYREAVGVSTKVLDTLLSPKADVFENKSTRTEFWGLFDK